MDLFSLQTLFFSKDTILIDILMSNTIFLSQTKDGDCFFGDGSVFLRHSLDISGWPCICAHPAQASQVWELEA